MDICDQHDSPEMPGVGYDAQTRRLCDHEGGHPTTTEDRVLDWLDRHDRHITVALVGPVLLLALLVAGAGAIRL